MNHSGSCVSSNRVYEGNEASLVLEEEWRPFMRRRRLSDLSADGTKWMVSPDNSNEIIPLIFDSEFGILDALDN